MEFSDVIRLGGDRVEYIPCLQRIGADTSDEGLGLTKVPINRDAIQGTCQRVSPCPHRLTIPIGKMLFIYEVKNTMIVQEA